MKRTGELLKKAREQKGLSINEIGLSLKISSKILLAIEEGDLSQLPAKTFLRGFVQSYASYLRLDVNEILKIFQEEMGSTRPSPLIQMPERDQTLENEDISAGPAQPSSTGKSTASNEKSLSSLSRNNNSRTITITVICVALVSGIIFIKKMIDKYQKEGTVSEIEVTTPIATTETPAAAAMSTPLPISTPIATTPAPTVTAVASSTPMPTPQHTPTPTPVPTVTPTPTATPTPTPKPTPTPSPTPTPTATPSPSPSPAANKPVEVIVEALDAVEVEFTAKDGTSEKITLSAEQIHTFKSKNGLRLNISNGGAVNVIVNGKDLGIPGNLGKPVKLNY